MIHTNPDAVLAGGARLHSAGIAVADSETDGPSRVRTNGSDFAVLSRRINGEGLMQRRPTYYIARLAVVAAMFIGGWVAFFAIGSSWWQLVTAAFLAVTFTQVGLVAH